MKTSRFLGMAKGYIGMFFSFRWIVWLLLGIAARIYSLFVPPKRANIRF